MDRMSEKPKFNIFPKEDFQYFLILKSSRVMGLYMSLQDKMNHYYEKISWNSLSLSLCSLWPVASLQSFHYPPFIKITILDTKRQGIIHIIPFCVCWMTHSASKYWYWVVRSLEIENLNFLCKGFPENTFFHKPAPMMPKGLNYII